MSEVQAVTNDVPAVAANNAAATVTETNKKDTNNKDKSVFAQAKEGEANVSSVDDNLANPYEKEYSSIDKPIDEVTNAIKALTQGTAGVVIDITGFGVKLTAAAVEEVGTTMISGAKKACEYVADAYNALFGSEEASQAQ